MCDSVRPLYLLYLLLLTAQAGYGVCGQPEGRAAEEEQPADGGALVWVRVGVRVRVRVRVRLRVRVGLRVRVRVRVRAQG